MDHLLQEAISSDTPPQRLNELAWHGTILRRAVAENPAAPPALLHKLAVSKDTETRKRVAGNPNAAAETLLDLLGVAPLKVVHNPAFALMMLSNPLVIRQTPYGRLRSLLDTEDIPEFLLPELVGHPDYNVRFRFVQLSSCRVEHLVALAADTTPSIRAAVAQHPLTPEATLVELTADPAPEVQTALARRPSRPAALEAALAREPDALDDEDITRLRLPSLTVELLDGLPPRLQRELLIESRKYGRMLIAMLMSPDPQVRQKVARQKRGVGDLGGLVDDPHPSVRQAVAENEIASRVVVDILADDKVAAVRAAAASHPKLSPAAVSRLACDPQPRVRAAVASRPKLPRRLRESLAADSSPLVRRALLAAHGDQG